METTAAAVERLLEEIEKTNKEQQLLDCLSIFEKLISNIVSNPMEPKFRTIKTTNAAIKGRLLNIKGIENLINLLGYRLEGEVYSLSDDNLAKLLSGAPFIDEHRRLIAAKLSSPEDYAKELTVVRNQRQLRAQKAKEAQEQQRLRKQTEADKKERAHMKADTTQSKNLQFGTKQTTWKDIGVDLCKKGGG